jgi:hypothetical protein
MTTSSAAHRLDQVLAAITGSSIKMVADLAVIEEKKHHRTRINGDAHEREKSALEPN